MDVGASGLGFMRVSEFRAGGLGLGVQGCLRFRGVDLRIRVPAFDLRASDVEF